jgi:hypothetical protein
MPRWIALIVFVGTLSVMPPVQADVTLSLAASELTSVEGDPVVFTGRARNAPYGSVIRLQMHDGQRWRTLAERTLKGTRSYSFRRTPARGVRIFRVVKPRMLHAPRRVSAPIEVTVRWRPQVEITKRAGHSNYMIRVDGGSGLELTEQRRWHPEAAWVTTRTVTLGEGGWGLVGYDEDNYEVRYVVPEGGLRLRAVSDTITVDDPNLDVMPHLDPAAAVNSADDFNLSGSEPGVAIFARTGTHMFLTDDDNESSTWRLFDPDGALLGRGTTAFEAQATGWYSLTAPLGTGTMVASVPLQAEGAYGERTSSPRTADGTPASLNLGQPLDIRFTGTADDVLTIGEGVLSSCRQTTLFDPNGEVVAKAREGITGLSQDVFLLATSGDHVLRLRPCGSGTLTGTEFMLHRGLTVQGALDEATTIPEPVPGQAQILNVEIPAGTRFTPSAHFGAPGRLLVLGPDGVPFPNRASTGTPTLVSTQSGTHRLIYTSAGNPDRPAYVEPVSLTAQTAEIRDTVVDAGEPLVMPPFDYPQEVGARFEGAAGELVALSTSLDDQDRPMTLVGSDGTIIAPTLEGAGSRPVWTLPDDGIYTALVAMPALPAADGPEVAVRTPIQAGDVTAPGVLRLSLSDPHDTIIGRVHVAAGPVTAALGRDTFATGWDAGRWRVTVHGPGHDVHLFAPQWPTFERLVEEATTYTVMLQTEHPEAGSVDVSVGD